VFEIDYGDDDGELLVDAAVYTRSRNICVYGLCLFLTRC